MRTITEEKEFLRLAVDAIPRVTELVLRYSPEDRAGALEVVERYFLTAALDYGCTEITAQSRVSAIMRRVRGRLARQQTSEKKLKALRVTLGRSRLGSALPSVVADSSLEVDLSIIRLG